MALMPAYFPGRWTGRRWPTRRSAMKTWLHTARRFPVYTERVDSCDLWHWIAGAVSGCHSCLFPVIWAWILPWRLKKAVSGAYIELTWFLIISSICHVSGLSCIYMSDLMCNSVFLSAFFPLSFMSVNISLQARGVCRQIFCTWSLNVPKGKGKGKGIVVQALGAPGGWGWQDLWTVRASRWQGCQSYASVAFNPPPQEITLVLCASHIFQIHFLRPCINSWALVFICCECRTYHTTCVTLVD
jgi:hypothetical protein